MKLLYTNNSPFTSYTTVTLHSDSRRDFSAGFITFTPFHVPCHMTEVQGESRITSHLHHIATSGIAQGVRHFLKQERKRRNKTHFLALALTLHYTTSNFEEPCTLFRLMCTAQPSYKCHTTLRMRNARSTHTSREGA